MIWLCVYFNHNKLFSIKRTLVLITFSITSQTIYQTVGSLLNELNVSQDMKFYVQAPKKASWLWNPRVIWIHVSIKVKHVCTYFHLSIFVQSAVQCHYQNERKSLHTKVFMYASFSRKDDPTWKPIAKKPFLKEVILWEW